MASLDAPLANELRTDFLAIPQEIAAGVIPGQSRQSARHWEVWCTYCESIGTHPSLATVRDPIPYLQIFARRYRDGRLSPSGRPVRSRTVEDALRSVGQAFSALGASDPRESAPNKIDFRLQRQLRGYKRNDPAPARVRPIPWPALREAQRIALSSAGTEKECTLVDLMWIAYFFLLRPGEYLYTTGEHAFRLQDIVLRIGSVDHNATNVNLEQASESNFIGLTFTEQKNGVKGEIIGLTPSGDPWACAVKAIVRRVVHLRRHHAHPDTKLYTYFDQHKRPHHLGSSHLTEFLRLACLMCSLPTHTVSARALRTTGATALLQGRVPISLIQLVGRWRSDEVFRYLHTQSEQLMRPLAPTMLQPAP